LSKSRFGSVVFHHFMVLLAFENGTRSVRIVYIVLKS